MRLILLLCLALFTSPVSAHAQTAATRTAQAVIADWKGWMATHDITQGAIAVSYRGDIIAKDGVNRSADDPAPIASLSKAITGVCTLMAMEATGTPHTTRLPQAMPDFFSKFRARDRRLLGVTIGHLLTQDSGIQTDYITRSYPRLRSFAQEQKTEQMRMITRERLGTNPGRSNYHYANANYLTLGLVIEELTGENYETYCKRTVLSPLGITTARLSENWKVLSSFGGWEVSAADYLTFLNAYFGKGLIMGKSATSFTPKTHIGNNRYYGPGVLLRRTDKGTLFWHAGSWRWNTDERSDAFGAYFLMLDDGLAMTMNYNDDAFDGELQQLERIIWDRTHGD